MKTILYGAAALILLGSVLAERGLCGGHCQRCGCECDCCKTCRLVCETKKVPVITYECKCEDFCVPGPSDCCVTYDECGCKQKTYTPTCAKVRTRKVLVKKETPKEVPTYKWVVENVCAPCACKCQAETAANQQNAAAAHIAPTGVMPVSYQSPVAANAAEAPKSNLRRVLGPIFGQN